MMTPNVPPTIKPSKKKPITSDASDPDVTIVCQKCFHFFG